MEGPADVAFLVHLLNFYHISIAKRGTFAPGSIRLEDGQGFEQLRNSLRERLQIQDEDAALARLGIVIDADTNVEARWQSLYDVLRGAGYTRVPRTPHPDGTIIEEEGLVVVGVWLMPDNQLPGALEQFAQFLLPANDRLWDRAGESIQQIPEADRLFSPQHIQKAHIHTWLAWQEQPGTPLGLAITRRCLDANAPHAQQFIAWIRRLFALDAA